jgi:hypothetical protein
MCITSVVDLRHYLDPSGAFADMPAPARPFAEYFASIVVDATANLDDEPRFRCRRRPGRRRCTGIIMSYLSADELERIHWRCPVCNDNGFICGWQDTLWDGFAVNTKAHWRRQCRGYLIAYYGTAADAARVISIWS